MSNGGLISGTFSSDTTLSTPVAINKGGTGQTTAQAALDALAAASGTLVRGDIFTVDSSLNMVRLARGSDNQTMMINGSDVNWETVSAGGGGTQVYGIFSVSSSQNAVAYGSPFGTFFGESAEALAVPTIDAGMTMTNFKAKAVLNAKDAATTWVWRDDGADIGTPLSIDASSTAEFSSGTVSIAIAAGSQFGTKRDTSASSSGAFMLAFLLGQVDY